MLSFFSSHPIMAATIIIFYILGLLCAAAAILRSRTPQGATAWIVALVTIPFFTVPLYIVFGRSKFLGYTTRRKIFDEKVNQKFLQPLIRFNEAEATHEAGQLIHALTPLCKPGFTTNNSVKLLIDGKETYGAMMAELEAAERFIIFQFYVFRPDTTGATFAEILMRKARSGVMVNFLYDEIGSEIPVEFMDEMKSAGVNVCHFNSLGGKGRFQVNFRNHRKILIVDGKVAFVGGINIGDDYLGLWPMLGPWRDTHLMMKGPSVLACQLIHAKDWFWCREKDLAMDWQMPPSAGEANILVLPSGPADEKQSCLLAHMAMVNSAQERLWIANPYLVPPESLLNAILSAALRGVDVRIILPSYTDAWIIMLASNVYIKRLLDHGVKVFRYRPGFLHQKVLLVDHTLGTVGSANLDFRSMFINFEISVMVIDEQFVKDLETMLVKDMSACREVLLKEFEKLSLWQKLSSRAANLLAPIL